MRYLKKFISTCVSKHHQPAIMTIASPCVRNCCLDKRDVCIGCGRTLDEIVRWGDADDNQQQQILLLSKRRIAERRDNKF